MVKRINCKTEGCEGLILQATADKTGGYCMPCVQKKQREEREKYIKENRKDIDPYDGVTDSVEIIKIMHLERQRDPLINYLPYSKSIEELYSSLNEFDEARLISYVISETESDNTDLIESICLELAAFRNANLSKLQKFLIDKHEYYPSMLFKHANRTIVKTLFERLNKSSENKNHILSALAWIDDSLVEEQFSDWISNPPDWSNELYIPPQNYSKDAGWLIDKNNTKKNLYLEKCYPLLTDKDYKSHSNISTCTLSKEHCQWCKRELTNLFEFDLSNPVFDFIPFAGEKLIIATCHVCSSYSDSLFMEVTEQGKVSWSSFNNTPEYLPDDSDTWDNMPENCLTMSNEPRAVDYAANWFLPTAFSQVGGMPTWIQDTAYPDCPNCNETMTFVAQISNEDIEEYGEGIYYSFLCPACSITATNYQQT